MSDPYAVAENFGCGKSNVGAHVPDEPRGRCVHRRGTPYRGLMKPGIDCRRSLPWWPKQILQAGEAPKVLSDVCYSRRFGDGATA